MLLFVLSSPIKMFLNGSAMQWRLRELILRNAAMFQNGSARESRFRKMISQWRLLELVLWNAPMFQNGLAMQSRFPMMISPIVSLRYLLCSAVYILSLVCCMLRKYMEDSFRVCRWLALLDRVHLLYPIFFIIWRKKNRGGDTRRRGNFVFGNWLAHSSLVWASSISGFG